MADQHHSLRSVKHSGGRVLKAKESKATAPFQHFVTQQANARNTPLSKWPRFTSCPEPSLGAPHGRLPMISLAQCAAFAGLRRDEIVLGVTPSVVHDSLLASYLLNLRRGPTAVRDIIVGDLRRFRELGALQRTADLFFVLRVFLTRYPEARCVQKHKKKFRANESVSDGGKAVANEVVKGDIIELARWRPRRVECFFSC